MSPFWPGQLGNAMAYPRAGDIPHSYLNVRVTMPSPITYQALKYFVEHDTELTTLRQAKKRMAV